MARKWTKIMIEIPDTASYKKETKPKTQVYSTSTCDFTLKTCKQQ